MAAVTQLAAGTGLLFVVMHSAWAVLGPTPDPIVIHSLRYEDGYIVQDRTVNSDGKFTAVWQAHIQNKATGEVVPGCEGTGTWDYAAGHRTPRIPLSEWVGNPDCRLGEGTFIPVATYSAGTFQVVERGEEFVK